MEYFKQELDYGVVLMIAISGKEHLTVYDRGNIIFDHDMSLDSEYYLEQGAKEISREEFNEFFIEQKSKLDGFIKEM